MIQVTMKALRLSELGDFICRQSLRQLRIPLSTQQILVAAQYLGLNSRSCALLHHCLASRSGRGTPGRPFGKGAASVPAGASADGELKVGVTSSPDSQAIPGDSSGDACAGRG